MNFVQEQLIKYQQSIFFLRNKKNQKVLRSSEQNNETKTQIIILMVPSPGQNGKRFRSTTIRNSKIELRLKLRNNTENNKPKTIFFSNT